MDSLDDLYAGQVLKLLYIGRVTTSGVYCLRFSSHANVRRCKNLVMGLEVPPLERPYNRTANRLANPSLYTPPLWFSKQHGDRDWRSTGEPFTLEAWLTRLSWFRTPARGRIGQISRQFRGVGPPCSNGRE